MEDIIERVVQVLNGVGISRIRSAEVGQSPLRKTKSVTISETCEGVWKAEEDSCEEGVIVYVAIKYHDRGTLRCKGKSTAPSNWSVWA